jgi:hypothetical protein
MKLTLASLTALTMLFAVASAQAAEGGASANSPGYQKQESGSVPGSPGASGYSPGHSMQDEGSVPGSPGASGYAPGKQGTGEDHSSSRIGKNSSTDRERGSTE